MSAMGKGGNGGGNDNSGKKCTFLQSVAIESVVLHAGRVYIGSKAEHKPFKE